MKETISIVVPIYNLEDYIRDCVDSILTQTYTNIEVILVDDGSADSSSEICQDYAEKDVRVKYIRIEPNRGVVHARKEGILAATGKYIGFVDGDDWIEPTMYEELIRHAEGVDLVSCGYYQYLSEISRKSVLNDFSEGKHDLNEELIYGRMLYDIEKAKRSRLTAPLWNKIFIREKLTAIYEDMDERLTYSEDLVLLYKYILRSERVYFIHKNFYHYRFRRTSVCNVPNNRFLENLNRAYCLLEKEFLQCENSKELLLQLQKWMQAQTCEAINDHMGFEQSVRVPRYLIDTECFVGKRIVLYGAGQAGKDYYWQLKKRGCDVVLWVDGDAERYQREELPIVMPQEIETVNYDVILVGVKEEELALKIKEDLVSQGFKEEQVLWKKPLDVY